MGQSQLGSENRLEIRKSQMKGSDMHPDDFVLEKNIFNNIFEKDIRRVFIYKKAERLAKAIHLVAPAFAASESLRNRIGEVAIGLVDAAILPTAGARTALARELLTLSSVLSIARAGGLLSDMNVDLITREAHILLQEVAAYEEPRLSLDEAPTLSDIAKRVPKNEVSLAAAKGDGAPRVRQAADPLRRGRKGHIKDIASDVKDRRGAVLSIIGQKGTASIKDISTHIRGVSEKTIQRELIALIDAGLVRRQGERRWSTYSLS